MPWRNTKDPYLIWLSEVILQQTQVRQGLPYYQKFSTTYPTVSDLASASEDQVMKHWQGLGYYSRARNMLATARLVDQQWGRNFPSDYETLIQLKGIGEYTASAVSSIAANEARAVVDGNVYRLLSRFFGIETPIDTAAGKREFASLANQLLDKKDPGNHNQAMMEFGSMQCRPTRPACHECKLATGCVALQNGTIAQLPVKTSRTQVRKRYFNYLIIRRNGQILINRRGSGDIWQSLYDFPLIETTGPIEEAALLSSKEFKEILNGENFSVKLVSKTIKHVLSHQVIFARFWELNLPNDTPVKNNYIQVEEKSVEAYAFPKLISNYLENNHKL